MESLQIITDAISIKPTARQPVALLSAGAWTLNQQSISLEQALGLGHEKIAEVIINTNEAAKSDIVWPGSGYHNLAIKALGGKIKFRASGTPDVISPPIGHVNELNRLKLDNIKTDKDLTTLFEAARHVQQKIGHKTLVGSSQWGPFTLAGFIIGIENLMRSIIKDKAVVHEVLAFSSELCYQYLNSFIGAGVKVVSIAEPSASGDLISPTQFEEFTIPYIARVTKKLKESGTLVFLHICGDITNRLHLIPQTGIDVLSVDYKVNIEKAVEIVRDKIALAGNLNPVAIMQNGTPEQVAEAARQAIQQARSYPGYILMPGCDIPPGVPLENVKAMVRAAYEYSARPLNLPQ